MNICLKNFAGGERMKNKALTGIFFILSCFVAMFVLMEFHSNYLLVGGVALVLLISSFFFLNALFVDKAKEWGALKDMDEKGSKESSGSDQAEFEKKILTYMEKVNKSQMQMLQKLKSLEDEISSLSEKQLVQTKMIVKYNKENARQVALSEKKVVEQAVNELREIMMSGVLVSSSSVNEVKVPLVDELSKEEKMVIPEQVVELPNAEEMVIPEQVVELPKVEEMVMPEEIPELPAMEDFDLPILDDIIIPEEQPVVAEPVASDPNKMMTPDDIAKLLASMGM